MTERAALWDAPLRLFHWALALLVVFSFVTGKLGGGWMAWHVRSGYGVLALLVFRLAWGMAGGDTARFAGFVRGPRAVRDYARHLLARRAVAWPGHNPLGGWMVLLMLAALLAQAATGLFADDEIATQGPLAALVSNAWVSRLTTFHRWNEWLVVGVVVAHVAAIAAYQWGLKLDLLGPMIHGGAAPEGPGLRRGSSLRALVLFAMACAVVYGLVALLPGSP